MLYTCPAQDKFWQEGRGKNYTVGKNEAKSDEIQGRSVIDETDLR
jgi:hypothetical protein